MSKSVDKKWDNTADPTVRVDALVRPRPILRYHGGKWLLAPWIISYFPNHRIYVEPFGGGASVLLRKPRSYSEVYNDLDGEIVNLFRVLRDPKTATRLIRRLELTPFARDEFSDAYQQDGDPIDPIEMARKTLVRSYMGFGSAGVVGQPTGFRANSKRSATIPAHDWRNYPEALKVNIERLRGVVIENRPAIDIIRQHDSKKTLFYVDPPYPLATRYKEYRTKCYRHEMTDSEHFKLAEVLKSVKGMVIISSYPGELYDDLYNGWEYVERDTFADGAKARVERLWFSPNCRQTLPLFDAV